MILAKMAGIELGLDWLRSVGDWGGGKDGGLDGEGLNLNLGEGGG